MTTLVVASAGGHLNELLTMLPRLGDPADVTFVTYDVPQSRGLLARQQVVPAYHPTTKNIPNTVRNYRLARRVFAAHDIHLVISTGAAVAVPFMLRAHQIGIPSHYIESATRVDDPSLSGRILQRLRGIHLYRQLGDWGGPRWQQGPCVFDGFATVSAEAGPVFRAFVSLGTHDFAFPALIERLATCFRGRGIEVLWQLGSTPDPGDLPGEVVDLLPADELEAAIADADVVVGHAGVGLTLTALRAGTVPVLVPRRRSRREHTDDHQAQLARELAARNLAITAEVDELTVDHLERAASLAVTYEEPEPFELVD